MPFEWAFGIYLFIIGICSGSFYNVVGLRVPRGQSIVFPRSHCTKCDRTLQWYELVPVLSWLVLLGKCRKCKTKISPIYPIIEFITGVLFVLVYLEFGLTVETFFYILLSSLMVIISVSDIDTRLIPNKILGVFLVLLLPVTYFVEAIDWKSQVIGVILAFAINYLILLFSKGKGMGGGDIKLFMLLALVLGWKSFITLFFLSVVIGMFVGIYTKVRTKESEIPFGPSIALATIITIFYGQELLKWYLNLYI